MAIFYTFIFVKDEMHVDFYQRNTNTVFCMAFKVCLSLTQCTYALQKAASINKYNLREMIVNHCSSFINAIHRLLLACMKICYVCILLKYRNKKAFIDKLISK